MKKSQRIPNAFHAYVLTYKYIYIRNMHCAIPINQANSCDCPAQSSDRGVPSISCVPGALAPGWFGP